MLELCAQAGESTEKFRLLAQALIKRRQPGDLAEALSMLRRWSAWDAQSPEPWQRLLEVHIHEGRLREAYRALAGFENTRGDPATAQYLRALLLHLDGKLVEALEHYRAAIGNTRLDSPALDVAAAMQACETAAGNYPGSVRREEEGMFESERELGILEQSLLRWEAMSETPPAAETVQRFSDAWYNLGCAALASYTADDRRIDLFQKAIDLNPTHSLARMNRVFAMNYSTRFTPEASSTEHLKLGQWLESRYGRVAHAFANVRSTERPLRIGYLSSDFRNHSVASFILPVIERHDRERFDLSIYYNHAKADEFTHRARVAASHFRTVKDLSDEALCNAIRADGIDILIELNGLTQNNRMPVLAMRAAPVQVTWLGYPATTGLRTVDYRIVDRISDPPEFAASLNVERLLYMPNTFSVYEAPADLPPVAAPPCLNNGYVTFGSFNNLPKLNDDLIRVWSTILHRVAGSRMLLKSLGFSFAAPRQQALAAFHRHGIGAERVEFLGHTPGKKEHLAAYGRIDISLDSFPYHGTTTTCESLIMGVPVITRAGRDHRSRVGASLLGALALDSLVSSDENAYIDAATGLAGDGGKLTALRERLRERMQSSALMDASRFTRDLESELLTTWARWCKAGI